MHILDTHTLPPLAAPDGGFVRELIGKSAGGFHSYSIAQITMPPGAKSTAHYHPVVEESYYILSGMARLEIDGESYTLNPGQLIAIQPKQVHQICNDSQQEDLIFLAICSPSWTPDCSVET